MAAEVTARFTTPSMTPPRAILCTIDPCRTPTGPTTGYLFLYLAECLPTGCYAFSACSRSGEIRCRARGVSRTATTFGRPTRTRPQECVHALTASGPMSIKADSIVQVVHMFHGGLWGGWQYQLKDQDTKSHSLLFSHGQHLLNFFSTC